MQASPYRSISSTILCRCSSSQLCLLRSCSALSSSSKNFHSSSSHLSSSSKYFHRSWSPKRLQGGASSKTELLSALRSTREDIKFLNEENRSLNEENNCLNDLLSSIEHKMKEMMNMKEFFVTQQSHVPPTNIIRFN
ncbi:uncharacterized protein LOC107001129 [Solanum pennellii]|uniref:Uncharacterized protein LOC107001129 n=1 Tax=Solanum pennellii TaxID=28526 RepID=A0ABM1FC98_SOLPN|nr:uncharacterized protein LOC107001129 [Solanum pennellii]